MGAHKLGHGRLLSPYAHRSSIFGHAQLVARMLVPKMVKNGFNSVLQTSAGSRRLVAARNSGTMRSPKLSPNHKRPIKTILLHVIQKGK